MRVRKRPHIRLKKPQRHKKITFAGDDGKLWRGVAFGAAALVLLVVLIVSMRPEPQLMSSAEIQNVLERGALRVGVRRDMPGFSSENDGLEVALAGAFAKRMLPDISVEAATKLVTVNSATAGPRLDDATIDIALALLERGASSKYLYSDPYYTDTARFILPRGHEALTPQNTSVGVLFDTAWLSSQTTSKIPFAAKGLLKTYIEANPNLNLTPKNFASYEDMLSALQSGQIGAAVITDLYIARYRDAFAFDTSSIELGAVEYAMACTTDAPAFVQLFNLMLSEMRHDGTLDALYLKYGLQ